VHSGLKKELDLVASFQVNKGSCVPQSAVRRRPLRYSGVVQRHRTVWLPVSCCS